MPRTKGSKNKPKAINDYTSQITEKQETIASLNTEIVSIQKAIEEQKNTLKEKKIALKKAEKEVGGRKIFCVYGKNSSLIRNRYV